MNDEDIKKALECCGDETGLHWCTGCPYYNKENDLCQEDLNRDSLALINRQQAEIERLQSRNKFLEIEYKNQGNLFWARVETAKSEAIKEFAVKLKCGVSITSGVVTCADIDNLLAEMVGEQNV